MLRISFLLYMLTYSVVAHAHPGETRGPNCCHRGDNGLVHCHCVPADIPTVEKQPSGTLSTYSASNTRSSNSGSNRGRRISLPSGQVNPNLLCPESGEKYSTYYYEKFCLHIGKSERGAVLVHYLGVPDTDNIKRKGWLDRYHNDCGVTADEKQKSSENYQRGKTKYEVGHMVPINHFDHSKSLMRATNCMSNMWPQHEEFNPSRNSWHGTERVTECYRETQSKGILDVWAGPLWEENNFIKKRASKTIRESHGIEIPSHFWKIIYSPSKEEIVAWIFPNNSKANIDSNLATVKKIEDRTGFVFESIPDNLKNSEKVGKWILRPKDNSEDCGGEGWHE